MDYRKIIKFGNSSHVVSIPNYWLKKNKLNKGDLIYFEENGNNELVFSPKEDGFRRKLKEISVNLTNKNIDEIKREIISGYINGYNVFRVTDDNLKNNAKKIRSVLHDLMGLEIMEQTTKMIVAKDLLNPRAISINNLIRRIDITIKSMIEESKKSHTEDIINSLYDKDEDVNRLTYLAFRVIKIGYENPQMMKLLKTNNAELLKTWQLIFNLEEVADEIKRIAKYCKQAKLKDKQKKDLDKLYLDIVEDYEKVMKAYFTKDINLALDVSSRKKKIIDDCGKFFEKSPGPHVGRIVEKLRGLEIYIRNIARIIYQ